MQNRGGGWQHAGVPPLAIAADDRTGALEVAGECADRGAGPVLVTVLDREHRDATPRACSVVDLGSRHLPPEDAAARAASVDVRSDAGHRAHKIDSLLRGNWAVELVARQRASGRPVLVVAALPAMGRTCLNGVVRVDGVPLAELPRDARAGAPPAGSRPADHLLAAGATDVIELRSPVELSGWRSAFAIADAGSPEDLAAIAAAWRPRADEVVLAGTAAAIAAAVVATESPPPAPVATGEIVVACGSLHPQARAQLDRLAQAGMEAVTVVASPEPAVRPVTEPAAMAAASRLAAQTRRVIDSRRPAAVVVIGGDTAAALLGDGPRIVGGTVVPGAPWSLPVDGRGPVVVTRAGSFGAGDGLVELIARLRGVDSR